MYSDETLNCTDCSRSFTFTTGEQEFFAQKGFTNKPTRCPDCRAARKATGQAGRGGSSFGGGSRADRQMHSATCGQCGKEALVPFVPSGDKPVYCRDCFQSRQSDRRY
jgi:CxxC-x17-CxxC domain-containing protein